VLGAGGKVAKASGPITAALVPTPTKHQALDAPIVVRDVFWHPLLAESQPAHAINQPPPRPIATALPSPTANMEGWIAPMSPGKIEVLPEPQNGKGQAAPAPPKKEEIPKKRLRVCGFLSSQTPTLILTLDGEDMKTCTKGQQPWPGVTIVEIGFDQATLKLQNRLIKVSMGQEVQI